MALAHPVTRAHLEALAMDGFVPSQGNVFRFTAMEALGQYALVELIDGDDADAGVQLPGTAGNRCTGITLESAADGELVAVCLAGPCKLTLGGTLTAPDQLSGATTGKGIAATTGHLVAAQLLQDGADTDVRWVNVVYGEEHA